MNDAANRTCSTHDLVDQDDPANVCVLANFRGSHRASVIHHGPATTLTFGPLSTALTGTYSVVVTPFAGTTAGPASDPYVFTVGGAGGACTSIAAPAVSGGVSGGIASIGWPAVANAIGYVITAGTSPGAANLVPPTYIGGALGASAPVPPGFQGWVRVQAVNACQQLGAPTDFLVR